jgi:uncharacterized repeat protein (TIGR02543 family)
MKTKHILKSILLIGTLVLASCNIQPSTSQSSSISDSSQVNSSSTSIVTSVSSISIKTNDSTTQFVGLTSKLTFEATINEGVTNPRIEWLVDGVRSLTQNGLVFEFLPTAAKNYSILAKVGNIESNIIQVSVGLPSFNIQSIAQPANNVIQVVAASGITFSIPGLIIANTSNYNFVTQTYNINLTTPMSQGATYTLIASRAGHRDLSQSFTYETRNLKVGYVLYRGEKVSANVDGVYVLARPFTDSNTPSSLVYELSLEQNNLEGNSQPLSIVTNVPTGATAVAPYQAAVNVQKNINVSRSYTLTSDATLGLYTHNVDLNGVKLTVRVQVIAPTPFLKLGSPVVYDTAVASGDGYVPMGSPFLKDAEDEFIKDVVEPETNSSTYIVYRPYNGGAKELTFLLSADFFPTPLGFPSVGNPYNILAALSGPIGASMNYGLSSFNTLTPSFAFRATIGNNYRVTQYIDNRTTLGTYNYTFTSQGGTVSLTYRISIVVRAFAPEIVPIITSNSQEVKPNSDGSYTIFKPLASNQITNSIKVEIENYESPLFSQTVGGEGLDTAYDIDGAGSSTVLKYLLNYNASYSGPLSGIANSVSKFGLELGFVSLAGKNADGTASDTVTNVSDATKSFQRFKAEGASAIIDLTAVVDATNYPSSSIFNNLTTLTSASLPGVHSYTIRIGQLTKVLTFRVEEPSPKIFVKDDTVKYGPTALSTTTTNVTFDKTDGKYYVNGKNGYVEVLVYPFGMLTGTYPFTFTSRTPGGSFQTVTNSVDLTLRSPYDGTLTFPAPGASGSTMYVKAQLSEEGEYTYSYTINGQLLTVTVVVLPNPQLKVDKVVYNNLEVANFDGYYYLNNSASDRFIELVLEPLNIKDDYKYVINSDGSFPFGAALTSARKDISVVDGRVTVGVTLPLSTATSDTLTSFFISLYKGSTRVGEITEVKFISSPLRVTVLFDSRGGTAKTPQVSVVGAVITDPTNPTRTGYTFGGWYNNPALSGTAVTFNSSLVTGSTDQVLYAKWTAVAVTITLNYNYVGADSGSQPANGSIVTTYDAVLSTLPVAPTRAGSTFIGWYDFASTNQAEVEYDSSSLVDKVSNFSLFARWTTP